MVAIASSWWQLPDTSINVCWWKWPQSQSDKRFGVEVCRERQKNGLIIKWKRKFSLVSIPKKHARITFLRRIGVMCLLGIDCMNSNDAIWRQTFRSTLSVRQKAITSTNPDFVSAGNLVPLFNKIIDHMNVDWKRILECRLHNGGPFCLAQMW